MVGIQSGFEVGIGGRFAIVVGIQSGLKLELGVGLKLEGSFPFLDWWCLVVQKRIEN